MSKRGWSRRSRKRFVYANGRPIDDVETLARLEALAIPPAWKDVWISPSPGAKLQATGIDAAGRTQYLYHPRFRAERDRAKFQRLVEFGEALPALRAQIAADMRLEGLSYEWTGAVALTLVNRAWFRPGSEEAARNARTYGVTTLSKRHVQVSKRRLTFRFRGKHQVVNRATLVDEKLAESIRKLLALPGGGRLFRYLREDDTRVALTAPQLNAYLRERCDPQFSLKDFRTWGGTLTAAIALAEHGPPRDPADAKKAITQAYRVVARELGNTPAVARSSYVSPTVISHFERGTTLGQVRSKRDRVLSATTGRLEPEERALLRLLHKSG